MLTAILPPCLALASCGVHLPGLPAAPPSRTSTPSSRSAPASLPSEPRAKYLVRLLPAHGDAPGTLAVELDLDGLDGPLALSLPQGSTFARLPAPRFAEEPRISGSERDAATPRPSLARSGPYGWQLDPAGATRARLAWSVPFDHREQPAVVGRDEYEFPYLADDHAFLSASATFVAPSALDDIEVRLELPEGWALHAPWPEEAGALRPASVAELQDDYLAVGDWSIDRETIGGLELTVAYAPGQEALRAAATARIRPIVEAELALFGSAPRERYLFAFGRPDGAGLGGSPKSGSMTLFVDRTLPPEVAIEHLAHLIAHEFFHTWGRARFAFPDELRFVAEGFTDYYAWRVPWRIGLVDVEAAREDLAQAIATYERHHAAAGLSLVEAGGPAFFAGGDAYHTIYQGGKLIAAWLDLVLGASVEDRAREGVVSAGSTASDEGTSAKGLDTAAHGPGTSGALRPLDRLMRRLHDDPRFRERAPTLDDFLALVAEAASPQHATRLRGWLESSEPLDVDALAAECGLALERRERPAAPTPGANFDGTTLAALSPTHSAALMGLRAGDRLIELQGVPVATEGELRAAWKPDADARFHCWYEREGEELELACPWPVERAIIVPVEWIERLR